MSQFPKLTVLIPTWNRVDRLRVTLPGLLDATRGAVAISVFDNASNDDTWAFLTETQQSDPRLEIFRQDENVGAIPNIVCGIERARTQYVCIVSDDDLVYGSYVDCVLQVLDSQPNIGAVHHNFGSKVLPGSCKFAHYESSPRAGYEAFRCAGSISGLTLNISALRSMPAWNKGISRALYPQVEWALSLALELGYAHLEGSGFRPGWPDTLLEVRRRQDRPADFGLAERVDISRGIPSRFFRARAINDLALWSRGLMLGLKEDPAPEARETHRAVTQVLQPLTPLVGVPVNSLALATLPTKVACTLDVGRRLVAGIARRVIRWSNALRMRTQSHLPNTR